MDWLEKILHVSHPAAEERRAFVRVPVPDGVPVAARATICGASVSALAVTDVSLGGCALRARAPFEVQATVGAVVDVELQLRGDAVSLPARIVAVRNDAWGLSWEVDERCRRFLRHLQGHAVAAGAERTSDMPTYLHLGTAYAQVIWFGQEGVVRWQARLLEWLLTWDTQHGLSSAALRTGKRLTDLSNIFSTKPLVEPHSVPDNEAIDTCRVVFANLAALEPSARERLLTTLT